MEHQNSRETIAHFLFPSPDKGGLLAAGGCVLSNTLYSPAKLSWSFTLPYLFYTLTTRTVKRTFPRVSIKWTLYTCLARGHKIRDCFQKDCVVSCIRLQLSVETFWSLRPFFLVNLRVLCTTILLRIVIVSLFLLSFRVLRLVTATLVDYVFVFAIVHNFFIIEFNLSFYHIISKLETES